MRTLRLAARALLRAPLVAAVAVASLALGFGANAAIVSIVRQVLVRPLRVQAPERLVNLASPGFRQGDVACGGAGSCDAVFSYPMVRDLEAAAGPRAGVAGVAGHVAFSANLAAAGRTVSGRGAAVTGSYFPVLGLTPALGRLLAPADDRPGAAPAAVLAHAFWATQLGADPAVVGRTVVVNGRAATVVGVAPRGFAGTTLDEPVQAFVPLALAPDFGVGYPIDQRKAYWIYLFARLAPGATADAAQRGLNAVYGPILRDVEAPLQSGMSASERARFQARPLTVAPGARGQTRLHDDARTPLVLLAVTTGVVLLTACANVANLLLVRGAGRASEMALRRSLGATRGRLLGLLLAESVLLAAAGGAAGVMVARLTLAGIARLLPGELAAVVVPTLDGWTLAVLAALALGTGLLFGLYPAAYGTRVDLASPMRAGAGQVVGGARAAGRFRSAMVAGQVALSMTLLVTAGLLARSLANIARERLGVDAERVVTFGVAPGRNGYTGPQSLALFARLEQELAALPGVGGVTSAGLGLLRGDQSSMNVTVEGFRAGPGANTDVFTNRVGPGYFRVLGTPLLAGREFAEADRAGAPRVVVVNEAFVRKFGLGRAAVGKRVARGAGDAVRPDREIVGVVRDAKYSDVKGEVPPMVFLPARQDTAAGTAVFYVRTAGDPEALRAAVPAAVRRVDANLPVEQLKTLPAQARENTAADRMVGSLAAGFALLATLLAAVGLYGVLAYAVAQRTRELGVRAALGAAAADLRRLVLGQMGRLVLAGGAAGLAAGLALGRAARSLLYGLAPHDPLALAAAAAALALVGAAAAYVPARRAARADPTQALRYG